MSKADAAVRIREVFDGIRAYVGEGHRLSEADTRAEFIDPVLAALGYRSIVDMRREVRIADTNESLDYVLQPDGKRQVAVEAKSIDRAILEKDAAQVVQYCSILGIRWAVVTNAREWRLYDQFDRGQLSAKLVYRVELDRVKSEHDQQADFERLWLLSADAFRDGDGPSHWIESRRMDAVLRAALVDERSQEIRYLRKRLEDQGIKTTASEVAAWFGDALSDRHQRAPVAESKPVAVQSPTPAPPSATPTAVPSPNQATEHYLVPASAQGGITAVQSLHNWLDSGKWGMHERTGCRRRIKAGDLLAFYAGKSGVVAYAQAAGTADVLVTEAEWPEPTPMSQPAYKVPLRNVTWLPVSRRLDLALRSSLDAFQKHPADGNWAWLVMDTHRITREDFLRLIGDAS